jgi:GT2 family glycosyltransferase
MVNPKVYIVILNYLQWEDTRDCLASVLASDYDNYSAIVVDNDSKNQSLEHLVTSLNDQSFQNEISAGAYKLFQKAELSQLHASALPRLSFIQNDSNEGFAGGNNVALRLLRAEDAYIWLLNPDMVVESGTLSALVRFIGQQERQCIAGAVVRSFHGNKEVLFYGGAKVNFNMATVRLIDRPDNTASLDFISGACLFTHADSFRQLGLLPNDYFLYWEETDWCYQAKQKGWQLRVCMPAICYDKISTVIGKSYLANYYYARNGLLFISKFRRHKIPMVLFFMGGRWLKRVITGKWGRARGIYKGTIDFFKRR